MRPMPRTQAPTTFQRRWPRRRRKAELKGVPDIRTEVFCYPMDMSMQKLGEAAAKDVRRVFPQGQFTQTLVSNHMWDRYEVHVTQTKAQRLQRS